jgi:hypothetical protein
MGSLSFLLPSDIAYPTGSASQQPPQAPVSGVPFHPSDPDGFLNKYLNPKQLPYPMPANVGNGGNADPPAKSDPPAQPVNNGGSSTAPASSSASTDSSVPTAPAASTAGQAPAPVTVVIAPWPSSAQVACPPTAPASSGGDASASSAPASSTSSAQSAQSAPVIVSKPACKILAAESLSPRFRAHHPKAHEEYLDEVLEEKVSVKMIQKDAAPVAFVVPDGCDSVEFSYGPIEVNQGVGKDHDLDQIVTVGEAALSCDAGDGETERRGPLSPGSALVVSVPWRAASWVDLPASRLKVTMFARFFASATVDQSNS